MRRFLMALLAVLMTWLPSVARAEVESSSASAFALKAESEVAASPEAVWRALSRVQNWWSPAHTYSGDARRLSLDPRAGGCFCERWGNSQSVEHARVLLVMEQEGVRTLRISGGLGPLQAMGTTGILTFTVTPHAPGAKITMTYRVSGDPSLQLNQIAPVVDQVLTEQFARLLRYTGGDSPD